MQQEEHGAEMLLVFSLTIYRITIHMRVAQNLIVCHIAIYNYLIQQIANLFSDF